MDSGSINLRSSRSAAAMRIFLDDQAYTDRKDWVSQNWRKAVNFEEFKQLLKEAKAGGESIESISFDNDLGEGEKEGWEILQWLSENHPELFKQEIELNIHSVNPSAKERMEGKINKLKFISQVLL